MNALTPGDWSDIAALDAEAFEHPAHVEALFDDADGRDTA